MKMDYQSRILAMFAACLLMEYSSLLASHTLSGHRSSPLT
jgi:hypothetical protein